MFIVIILLFSIVTSLKQITGLPSKIYFYKPNSKASYLNVYNNNQNIFLINY